MEVNANRQLINSSEIRPKRFNLNERLNKLASLTSEPTPSKAHFDWQFYLKYYEDLQTLSTYQEAYEHWLAFGETEGRSPNQAALEQFLEQNKSELPTDFDPERYLTLNPDLQKRFAGNSYRATDRAIEHYLTCGKQEGRLYRLQPATQNRQTFKTVLEKTNTGDNVSHPQWLYAHQDQSNQTQSPSIPRLIAFYLPQFHPIPENDRWWGKGFTEWTNVTNAKPLFDGHYQPQLPADLGFYDLRLAEVREEQANLARQYGIYGFCYYYYWFAGKRLLHRPLDDMLASGKPDFPFCICWANENWTRRWDGAEHEILMAQDYSEEQYQAFAEELVPILQDPRYIKIDGKPLIIIYRVDVIPDILEASQQWREVFRTQGVGEVHLCIMLTTFSGIRSGLNDIASLGFDSAVQFPPHETTGSVVPPPAPAPNFTGQFFDYKEVAINAVSEVLPNFKTFPGVMPSFDNTSRRKQAAHAFLNSTPETYEFWLRGAIEKATQNLAGQEQLVFINAWNEWAEGARLEPDQKYGHAYLQATRRALHATHSWRTVLDLLRYLPIEDTQQLNRLLAQLEQHIRAIEQASRCTIQTIDAVLKYKQAQVVNSLTNRTSNIRCSLDSPKIDALINTKALRIDGWVISTDSPAVAVDIKCRQSVLKRVQIDIPRPDVAQAYGIPYNTVGFCDAVDIVDMPAQIDLHLDLVFDDDTSQLMQVISLQSYSVSTRELEALPDKRQQLQRTVSTSLKEQINKLRAYSGERNNEFWTAISSLEKIIDEKEWYLKTACELLQQNQISDCFKSF